jgi:hypothetical protein
MKLATLAQSLPEHLKSDAEFALYGTDTRRHVETVLEGMRACAQRHTCVAEAVAAFGGLMGWSPKKARRIWDKVRHKGWKGALDGRRAKIKKNSLVSRPLFVAQWKALCDQHHGSISAAWHALVTLYGAGGKIDGYEEWNGRPEADARTGLPVGWSYRNLSVFAPDRQDRVMAHVGRKAFAAKTTALWTSRVGLHCGEVYQFDDVWHDHKVFFGRALVRIMELGAIDLFSTRRVKYGLAPRVRDEDGKNVGLKESYMQWLLTALLMETGYWPEGCTLIVEHGTAAISDEFEKRIFDASAGKIRVARSGIQNKPALLGWWAGEGGGNPRMKACLESLHGYYHKRLGLLPAQVGGNSRVDKPEALSQIEKYAASLARELDKFTPEQIDALLGMLRLPAVTFNQFHGLLDQFYTVIDSRDQHDLEGWDKAGLVRAQWRLSTGSTDWHDAGELATLAEEQYAVVRTMLDSNKDLMRPRRMSPLEVWSEGARRLRRLPPWCVHQLLPQEAGRELTVRNHRIEFADAEIDPDGLRYEGVAAGAHGEQLLLKEGEKYLAYVNPLAPRLAYLCEADGRYVGASLRIERAPRTSREAVFAAIGKEAARQTVRMSGYRARNAGEAVVHQDMLAHNVQILRDARAVQGAGNRPADDMPAEGGEERLADDLAALAVAGSGAERAEAFSPEDISDLFGADGRSEE